jgi:WD40 repeat protein
MSLYNDDLSRFLIAAGTHEYPNYPAVGKLPQVPTDVARISHLLTKRFGYKRILEEHSADPTSTKFTDALTAWLKASERTDKDVLAIYYSGHGKIKSGKLYLLTANSTENIIDTAIAADLLAARLDDSFLKRLLLMLDVCFAGQAADDIALLSRLTSGNFALTKIPEITVLSSARSREKARDGEFSKAFVQALLDCRVGSILDYLPLQNVLRRIGGIMEEARVHQRPIASAFNIDGLAYFPNPDFDPRLDRGSDLQIRPYLLRDPHWGARARGVTAVEEPGWYFSGRKTLLQHLVGRLRVNEPGFLIVTGQPGAGKSAVLAQLAIRSDETSRWDIPLLMAREVHVPSGLIDVSIHANSMLIPDVVKAIAKIVQYPDEDTRGLLNQIAKRQETFRILIDALDEAAEPATIISELIEPIVTAGARVIVGTRPEILRKISFPVEVIKIDEAPWVETSDISEYVERVLSSEAIPNNPFLHNRGQIQSVAAAVALKASPNFLVARIVARALASGSKWTGDFPTSVGGAFERDMDRFGSERELVRALLQPLAFAEGAGFPRDGPWECVAEALCHRSWNSGAIARLLELGGSYVVEGIEAGAPAYKLFHRALAEHLAQSSGPDALQGVFSGLVASVPPDLPTGGRVNWFTAPGYVRRHLSTHAARAGQLDSIMADPGFMLASDPARLLRAAQACRTTEATLTASLYQKALAYCEGKAITEAAAYLRLLALQNSLYNLSERIELECPQGSWSCRWADWDTSPVHYVLDVAAQDVEAIAIGILDDQTLVVCADRNGMLRFYDAESFKPAAEALRVTAGPIKSLALVTIQGRLAAALIPADGCLRLFDIESRTELSLSKDPRLPADGSMLSHVLSTTVHDRPVLITGGDDGAVRVWELGGIGPFESIVVRHPAPVTAVSTAHVEGRTLLISGAQDGTVRIWDATGAKLAGFLDIPPHETTEDTSFLIFWWKRKIISEESSISKVAIFGLTDRTVAVIFSRPGTGILHLWDVNRSEFISAPTHYWQSQLPMEIVCHDQKLLWLGGQYGFEIGEIGRAMSGKRLIDRSTKVVATGHLRDEIVVVSVGSDAIMRLWRIKDVMEVGRGSSNSEIRDLTVGMLDGIELVIAMSGHRGVVSDKISFFDLRNGRGAHDPISIEAYFDGFEAVKFAEVNGRGQIIVSWGDWVSIYDIKTREQFGIEIKAHRVARIDTCSFNGRAVFTIFGIGTCEVWDWADRRHINSFRIDNTPTAASLITLPSTVAAVTAEKNMRLWDLSTGRALGQPFGGRGNKITDLSVMTIEKEAIGAYVDGSTSVSIWDFAEHREIRQLHSIGDQQLLTVALGGRAGRLLVAAGGNTGDLHVFEFASGATLARIYLDSIINKLCFRGAALVAGTERGLVRIDLT